MSNETWSNLLGRYEEAIPDLDAFEISVWRNGGPGRTLSRRSVKHNSFAPWAGVNKLADDEEYGLSSRVSVGGRRRHLAMIDFAGRPGVEEVRRQCALLAHEYDCGFCVLSSGRSYHAYLFRAFGERSWVKFMGRLLLGTPPVDSARRLDVDVRWVGHSLENGFSCLRWSATTARYLATPEVVASDLIRTDL